MAEGSVPPVGDLPGSPDRARAAREAAWAPMRGPFAEAERPPLSAVERAGRAGYATLPMTDAVRARLREIPRGAQGRFYGYFFATLFLVMFGEIFVPLLVKKGDSVSLSPPALSLVAMVAGCPILVRWRRRRHIARVDALETYSRYAGTCEIKEVAVSGVQGSRSYMYDLLLPPPPAPSTGAPRRLRLDDFLRHEWLEGVRWRTVEFAGEAILSIRDDHDELLFEYPNRFPGEG